MRASYLFSLFLCAGAVGQAAPAFSASRELTVPNFDAESPACVVRVPANEPACTPEGCAIPPPKGSTLASIQLNFSCLPKAAPTGFEKPVEGAKVQSIRAGKVAGDLSLIDDIQAPFSERLRELNFCLYGKINNFCGNAKVMRLKDGARADASRTIKALIRGIELQDR